jgi:uncharacterized membrane protein YeaQ/YmgE (transglycosylase-associated protein family)
MTQQRGIVVFGDIIVYIVIGAIVGAAARLVLPGKQNIGTALTVGLGIVGAVVGGWITNAAISGNHNVISFIVSVVVAAILVALVAGRSRTGITRT